MLQPTVLSTLALLQTSLDLERGQEVIIAITRDKVSFSKDLLPFETTETPNFNPLLQILENIEQDMCLDCLKDEYNFKNEEFLRLFNLFIAFLVYKYGEKVPISEIFARRILKYYDGEHLTICVSLGDKLVAVDQEFMDLKCSTHDFFIVTT